MNRSWYIYYGRKLNMGREETLCTRYGEMQDMIACLSIENGGAEQIIKRRLPFEKVMTLE